MREMTQEEATLLRRVARLLATREEGSRTYETQERLRQVADLVDPGGTLCESCDKLATVHYEDISFCAECAAEEEACAGEAGDGEAVDIEEAKKGSMTVEFAAKHLAPHELVYAECSTTPGAYLISSERARQIEEEGWTPEHDDAHLEGELAWAAVCYAAPAPVRMMREFPDGTTFVDPWPFDGDGDKRKRSLPKTSFPEMEKLRGERRLDLLVKAGAFIAAEIDRLLRAQKEG